MSYKFNPFTGTLDIAGGAGVPAGITDYVLYDKNGAIGGTPDERVDPADNRLYLFRLSDRARTFVIESSSGDVGAETGQIYFHGLTWQLYDSVSVTQEFLEVAFHLLKVTSVITIVTSEGGDYVDITYDSAGSQSYLYTQSGSTLVVATGGSGVANIDFSASVNANLYSSIFRFKIYINGSPTTYEAMYSSTDYAIAGVSGSVRNVSIMAQTYLADGDVVEVKVGSDSGGSIDIHRCTFRMNRVSRINRD